MAVALALQTDLSATEKPSASRVSSRATVNRAPAASFRTVVSDDSLTPGSAARGVSYFIAHLISISAYRLLPLPPVLVIIVCLQYNALVGQTRGGKVRYIDRPLQRNFKGRQKWKASVAAAFDTLHRFSPCRWWWWIEKMKATFIWDELIKPTPTLAVQRQREFVRLPFSTDAKVPAKYRELARID